MEPEFSEWEFGQTLMYIFKLLFNKSLFHKKKYGNNISI